jgi:hypothetical protein
MARFARRVLQASSVRRQMSSNIEGGDYYRKTQNQHGGSPGNVQCKHFIDFVIFAFTAVLAEDERGFPSQAGAAKTVGCHASDGSRSSRRESSPPPGVFLVGEPLRPVGELFLATIADFYRHPCQRVQCTCVRESRLTSITTGRPTVPDNDLVGTLLYISVDPWSTWRLHVAVVIEVDVHPRQRGGGDDAVPRRARSGDLDQG